MTVPVRCARCGATTTNGAEFEIEQRYEAAATGVVVGSEAGEIAVRWTDRGDADRWLRAVLTCSTCGHRWRTPRRVRTEQ